MTAAVEAAPRRRVTILGSTGSVGRSTVDLIDRNRDRYDIEALTAYRSVERLAEQALRLRPRLAVVADSDCYRQLKEALSGTGIEVAAGSAAVVEAAMRPAEWVMSAIVGARGLEPTLAAAERGAMVAFANKECLVSAGPVMMDRVRRRGATLLPVDSEHNAIYQVFDSRHKAAVEKLILTASGGPFLNADTATMERATPQQAIAHPTWDMGAKISVDSATMMNKGLEIIEASYLFGLPGDLIEVLIHPQSVVHSMVAYVDGSVLAQLGMPDMRTPIAYALAWPERMETPCQRLDLGEIARLDFGPPDVERFPALRLAREALTAAGGAPAVLNAANEEAVGAFLAGRIGFLDIVRIVEATLTAIPNRPLETLADVIATDNEARRHAVNLL